MHRHVRPTPNSRLRLRLRPPLPTSNLPDPQMRRPTDPPARGFILLGLAEGFPPNPYPAPSVAPELTHQVSKSKTENGRKEDRRAGQAGIQSEEE